MSELDPGYWQNRWGNDNTPWDIGVVSPPIQRYIDQLSRKDMRILIPGAGRAHEAIYLHQKGFTQVYVCDWAEAAFDYLREQVPDFPTAHLLIADFFDLILELDLILEQTFFCAIDPGLRTRYAAKAAELLVANGRVAGLLFARPFPFAGPPFGGTEEEYREVFAPYFSIAEMSISPHSIKPRLGNELFFELEKLA